MTEPNPPELRFSQVIRYALRRSGRAAARQGRRADRAEQGKDPHNVKRRAAVVAKLVLGLTVLTGASVLAGCGAGAISQTADQASAVNGAHAHVGTIDLRDASIAFAGPGNTDAVYQVGQSAELTLTLVNSGATADRLVKVSSPVAESGEIQGDAVIGGDRAVQVGNTNSSSGADALADRTISIKLVGLKQAIQPGLKTPVEFTFERSGTVTIELPVGYPTGELAVRKSSG
jgi:periplasmic copper chaperone A